jgi:hypothetical protein
MQVLTLLPMTSQTISVRWPQTTIQKSRTYWTTINIQVLNIFEVMELCIVIFLLIDVLMGPIFVHSSLLTAHIATDTDERKKFVQTYLSSSGNLMFTDLYPPYRFLGIRIYQF